MPKLAVNPRRFSREDLDDAEPIVLNIALRAPQGNEHLLTTALRAVLEDHRGVYVTVTGVAPAGPSTRVTIGVYLGPASKTMELAKPCLKALRLVPAVMHQLFDFWPTFVVEPTGDEALRGAEYDEKILGKRPKKRKMSAGAIQARKARLAAACTADPDSQDDGSASGDEHAYSTNSTAADSTAADSTAADLTGVLA